MNKLFIFLLLVSFSGCDSLPWSKVTKEDRSAKSATVSVSSTSLD